MINELDSILRLERIAIKGNGVNLLMRRLKVSLLWLCMGAMLPVFIQAQEANLVDAKATLQTLKSIVETEQSLLLRLDEANKAMQVMTSKSGRHDLQLKELELREELQATRKSFDEIATENDISVLKGKGQNTFNLQREVLFLLEPALKEMKRMTSGVRNKSELREKIYTYDQRLKVAESAIENLNRLLSITTDTVLSNALSARNSQWQHQYRLLENDRQSTRLQLDKLVAKEVSFSEASQRYLKEFFQKRGLYLLLAGVVIVVIVLFSKLSSAAMHALFAGFRAKHRSFRIRLIQLLHQAFSLILLVVGPMIVFYIVEDWVLFSVGLLLLFAAAWTIRSAAPRYWQQMQLFLNIGSVREGERIDMDGIPWLVQHINLFTVLHNPSAGLKMRLPIDHLVGKVSRPVTRSEPWFPCKHNDWVILSDGCRGKVVGISKEFVQLVERGGAFRTYLLSDFLALSPHNISTSFRLREVIGVSYNLQKSATQAIPEALHKYIQKRIESEGYQEHVLNMRIEFSQAADSSLNIVVVIDFDGAMSEYYGRLKRSMQRWCVDACSVFKWEIPFPQLTVHKPGVSA
jgi:hypothetical protein